MQLQAAEPGSLPGTELLEWEGDLASQMIDGIDRFLLKKIDESVASRAEHWSRDRSSVAGWEKSIAKNRARLAHIIGVRDERLPVEALELLATTDQEAVIGRSDHFSVYAVRWPVLRDMHGEGLLLVPRGREPVANIIALPDADQLPEQIAGLSDGVAIVSQFARRLAESGCRVIVPTLISREMERRAPPGRPGRANLTHREYVYRPAYELGRHLIGYEVQKTLACVDWFQKEAPNTRIGVIGYGEGGMLALYAAAIDPRIDVACVSGHFGSRQAIWNEPLDRNVFGLLEQFGDAEISSLVAPRGLVIDSARGPELTLPSEGGAPAELKWHRDESIRAEHQRLLEMIGSLPADESGRGRASSHVHFDTSVTGAFCRKSILEKFLELLDKKQAVVSGLSEVQWEVKPTDTDRRLRRQIDEMDRHSQWLLRESPYVRDDFMSKLDKSSLDAFTRTVESYRDYFREEVVGHFEQPLLDPQTRSRKVYDRPNWTGYEVVLDVFPDVFAYGVLCVPKGIGPNERRPVVVCQHGLEGRPRDTIEGDHRAYHDYAAKLAERGFITFAPQNIYIFRDRFRTLQRKAYPIKKTLFSIMVPQHQQIVNWLKTLPQVDSERIAFYGLSYGGKSAMRIPPLVDDYCLSICSADFNEWVWKNVSTRATHSYVWTIEYEIFEFDLGSTFNYAEMAALIAPRPFMVERGHFDGVAPDETVAYEFAKVRHLYQARLDIGDRCEIEWFVGPHTINGRGTFNFLHKHLNWPK